MRRIVYNGKGLVEDHSDFATLEHYAVPEIRERLHISDSYAGECLKAVLDAMLHFRTPENVVIVAFPKVREAD